MKETTKRDFKYLEKLDFRNLAFASTQFTLTQPVSGPIPPTCSCSGFRARPIPLSYLKHFDTLAKFQRDMKALILEFLPVKISYEIQLCVINFILECSSNPQNCI